MSVLVLFTIQTSILPGTVEKTLLPHSFIPEGTLKFGFFFMALQHKAIDVIQTVFQLFFSFSHMREISSSAAVILEGIYTTLLLQQQAALTASSYR